MSADQCSNCLLFCSQVAASSAFFGSASPAWPLPLPPVSARGFGAYFALISATDSLFVGSDDVAGTGSGGKAFGGSGVDSFGASAEGASAEGASAESVSSGRGSADLYSARNSGVRIPYGRNFSILPWSSEKKNAREGPSL